MNTFASTLFTLLRVQENDKKNLECGYRDIESDELIKLCKVNCPRR